VKAHMSNDDGEKWNRIKNVKGLYNYHNKSYIMKVYHRPTYKPNNYKMTKKEIKALKRQRLIEFKEKLLPKIKFEVKEYPLFVKIFTPYNTFDYYPMGQRIAKVTNINKIKWRDLTIDEFKDIFIK
jgi:hypothetical protein